MNLGTDVMVVKRERGNNGSIVLEFFFFYFRFPSGLGALFFFPPPILS